MSSQTVALTGSTGFVGRHIARELTSRGYAVRALARDRDKAGATLPAEGVEVVLGDAGDARALESLCRGCRTVIHAIGIRRELPSRGETFEKAHVRSTTALSDAARSAGVSHFILISALGVRPDAPTAYYRSKYEGESIVRACGLEWTILRPSLIHGPDGEMVRMVKDWTLGRAAPRFFIPYFSKIEIDRHPFPHPVMTSARIAPVRVEDVARAAVTSIERPESRGEVYPLCGPETLEWPEFLAQIRDAVPLNDSKKPIWPIPGVKGVAVAHAAKAVGLGEMLPFGPDEPVMAMEDVVCSVAKAAAHLDFTPLAFSEALAMYRDRI